MPEGFDPYHKWLGIPPQEQPPDHYRLLAIPQFEADPEVIEFAADQRMGHVRTFQTGRYGAFSQQILNELAAARICLLSRERKSAYDAELKIQLAPAPPLPPSSPPLASTILPSPPPPIGSAPPLPPTLGQSEVASSSTAGVPGQASPLFPPLDSTLPDPTPPSVAVSRSTSSRSKSGSLIATAVGVTVLVFAATAFWILYTNQKRQDAALNLASDGNTSQLSQEPVAPVPDSDMENEAGSEQTGEASGTTAPASEESQALSDEPTTEDPPIPAPAKPAIDPRPSFSDLVKEATRTEMPRNRSLADLLNQAEESSLPATDPMDSSLSPEEEPADDSATAKELEKWRVPRPASRNRVAAKLQPLIMQANFSTLLIEAQKSDHPDTEVYVLLTAAHDKAVATLDAAGALQSIDLIEEKFLGDFDNERVESLRAIGVLLTQKRRSRELQDLADVALQASEQAQQAGNKPLARNLGNVALGAATQAKDTARQARITAHLNQL